MNFTEKYNKYIHERDAEMNKEIMTSRCDMSSKTVNAPPPPRNDVMQSLSMAQIERLLEKYLQKIKHYELVLADYDDCLATISATHPCSAHVIYCQKEAVETDLMGLYDQVEIMHRQCYVHPIKNSQSQGDLPSSSEDNSKRSMRDSPETV